MIPYNNKKEKEKKKDIILIDPTIKKRDNQKHEKQK